MIKNIQTVWALFVIYVRQAFHHKTAALAMILTWGLRIGVTIILYHGIYTMLGQATIRNITYNVAVSGMLLGMIYAGFGQREITRLITAEYKAGLISMWVNKPISYPLIKAAETIGKNIPPAIGLISCSIAFLVIGRHLPEVDHLAWRILAGTLLMVLGVSIGICLFTIAGLSAIFFQESHPVYVVIDKLMMVFGGVYIPMGFFPHWFRTAGESSPMGASILANQMFYPDFFAHLPRFVITQLVWLVLCGLLVRLIARKANRYLTVNGG